MGGSILSSQDPPARVESLARGELSGETGASFGAGWSSTRTSAEVAATSPVLDSSWLEPITRPTGGATASGAAGLLSLPSVSAGTTAIAGAAVSEGKRSSVTVPFPSACRNV